jgi:hypothetical protein
MGESRQQRPVIKRARELQAFVPTAATVSAQSLGDTAPVMLSLASSLATVLSPAAGEGQGSAANSHGVPKAQGASHSPLRARSASLSLALGAPTLAAGSTPGALAHAFRGGDRVAGAPTRRLTGDITRAGPGPTEAPGLLPPLPLTLPAPPPPPLGTPLSRRVDAVRAALVDSVRELLQLSKLVQWHAASLLVCPQALLIALAEHLVPPTAALGSTRPAGVGAGDGPVAASAGAPERGSASGGSGTEGATGSPFTSPPRSVADDVLAGTSSLWLPALVVAMMLSPHMHLVCALRAVCSAYVPRAHAVLRCLLDRFPALAARERPGARSDGVAASAPAPATAASSGRLSPVSPVARAPSPMMMGPPSSPVHGPLTSPQGSYGGAGAAPVLRVGDVDFLSCAVPLHGLLVSGLELVLRHGVLAVPRWCPARTAGGGACAGDGGEAASAAGRSLGSLDSGSIGAGTGGAACSGAGSSGGGGTSLGAADYSGDTSAVAGSDDGGAPGTAATALDSADVGTLVWDTALRDTLMRTLQASASSACGADSGRCVSAACAALLSPPPLLCCPRSCRSLPCEAWCGCLAPCVARLQIHASWCDGSAASAWCRLSVPVGDVGGREWGRRSGSGAGPSAPFRAPGWPSARQLTFGCRRASPYRCSDGAGAADGPQVGRRQRGRCGQQWWLGRWTSERGWW